jgi:hypothetical protein
MASAARSPQASCANGAAPCEAQAARDHWPVSGLATSSARLPARKRAVASTHLFARRVSGDEKRITHERRPSTKRIRDDLQLAWLSLTVAGAAQVGSSSTDSAPCFPFDCVRMNAGASTKSAASVGAAPEGVKKAERLRSCMSKVCARINAYGQATTRDKNAPLFPHTNCAANAFYAQERVLLRLETRHLSEARLNRAKMRGL